jgi:hypothetical protein
MRGVSFSPLASSSSASSSSLSTLTRERVFTHNDNNNNKSAKSSLGVGIDVSKTRMRRRRRSFVATTAKAAMETAFATSGEDVALVVVQSPPRTCSEAAIEARNVLRKLREEEQQPSKSIIRTTKRLRVELPLPREDKGDDIVWLGLHGQASDWSGGMSERFAKTKVVVETMLSGYEYKYLGLLDKDAEGMGLWTATEDMSVVTMPSDTTMQFFVNLLKGAYGARVMDEREHFLLVVNGFWSGSGEKCGQPWQFAMRREAKELLSTEGKRWEKVYSCRRARSAAGVEGTLVRRYPEPWSLFDARGVRLLKQWRDEPSNREIAETLNVKAGRREAVGFNKDAVETSRDDDIVT